MNTQATIYHMSATEYRWNILSTFVQLVCEGRDESHGHIHMKTVAETTRKIVEQDFDNYPNFDQLLMDAITVAWLHDVSDHKYDHDGLLDKQLDEFGYSNIANFEQIKKVVKLISYSSENRAIVAGTPLNYKELLGEHYATVRHIVSDADKLEAIGKIGIDRCIEYTKHSNPGIPEEDIVKEVKKHADEKLIRLKDEFIRTPTGMFLAEALHEEMLMILSEL